MLAAILFDSEARAAESVDNVTFGKLREPVVRFTHWARAFEINNPDASNERLLRDTGSPSSLGQQPYGASSVFNFYRPAYIAPGTETAAAGLTATRTSDCQCQQYFRLHQSNDGLRSWPVCKDR